ncbi:arsenate reductase/protein-tyrosine-phosphatase family protein [Paractinoplanes hotanensis]|uniref:ArsR family transcriptional regulator n=1 Tax=Paractinoplanes hotanensis TaxID=2906497 RepID=A0ABT0XYA6_9ACTN|nr:ArsR family transcriptional regulator [Actinoplanes hotanensis]MCM4078771.1 ArsR family transcriptional regulator [Actinoplanes hotanensis]
MTTGPPAFVTATGHPLRWHLLSELAHGDLAVRELSALLGQPQNLVSYHLGKLRKAELVSARRSSADGRDTYYTLDLARCGSLLAGAGAALHPGLRMLSPAAMTVTGRVLFLCTGNSARSQMAEALLRQHTAGSVQAFSAGSRPKPIHPYAVSVLATRGIDLTGARPKHLDEFTGRPFDRVITLCDKVKEVCPDFPGDAVRAHWSIAEPADLPAFEQVADELARRIGFLLHTLAVPSKEAS